MKENLTATAFYLQQINLLQQQLKALYKKRSVIAWLRFAVFLLTCFTVYLFWSAGMMAVVFSIICGITIFLILVSRDADNKTKIENTEILLSINKDEEKYLQQDFADKYDGKDLEPSHHAYAKDLDVFGPSSLFQYINRCHAEQGIDLLAKRLLNPFNKEQIIQQQKAITEISGKMNWWQQFQAYGLKEKITFEAENRINEWLSSEDKHYTNPVWKILLYIYPVITLSSFYLFLDDIIPTAIFSFLILVFFLIAFGISSRIQKSYTLLSKLGPVVSILFRQFNHFESENFSEEFFAEIKTSLNNTPGKTASSSIRNLQLILNRFDVRLNIFAFFILNTFLLWDLWQIVALNQWRETNKSFTKNWFKAIAQLEVAGSLSVLFFNNNHWCFPQIADEHFTLSCTGIGHPLINHQTSVTNNFNLKGVSKVDLITGSNMAGKSTFLRSLGVNMILAYTGSAVYAKAFTVSIAEIMSSMRIEDNLAENTSTFYAELKKLKSIIEAVNQDKKIFILLDEILRGTNSLDRHTGSRALIQQLIKKNAVAIIATHDIELSKLEHDFPSSISNYHFDVQVNGSELYFDYTLKHGICKSMNASVLMKKIGIEMPSDTEN
ncbi:MAG: hypothetical protein JST21_09850 [Bacteroidetes bacterium]|nr:hypothetical protein [Bacteroidota bacterium]